MAAARVKVGARPAAAVRAVEYGLLALLALMPFHAFLSVWFGSLIGHQSLIQAWKEGLLVVVVGLGGYLLWQEPIRRTRLRRPAVILAAAWVAVALVVTAANRPALGEVVFGLKTDFEALVAFALALMVGRTALARRGGQIVLLAGVLVVAFAMAQAFLWPSDTLSHFGYNPSTIVPYQVVGGSGEYRFGGTLGGPNQLGTYLILIMALTLAVAVRRRRWWLLGLVPLAGVALWHTYSRVAWLGAVVAVAVVAVGLTPRRWQAWAAGVMGLGVSIVAAGLAWAIGTKPAVRAALLHGSTTGAPSSDSQHLASLQTGLLQLAIKPWGHGLGTIGPATLQTAGHSDDGVIENYFLQVGYETGFVGLALFVAVCGAVAWDLARQASRRPLALGLLGALAGISVNALVLPAWTDSTTALTFWILTGLVIGAAGETKRV